MKVEILSVSGDVSLPTHAILKLYDHRYLSDRVNKEARDPWDADREKKAERIRKLLQEKKDVIEGRMPGPPRGFVLPPEQSALSSEEEHSSSEAGESESSTEEVGENKYFRILVNALEEVSPSDLSQWHTEKFYHSEVERLFCKETEAYSRLRSLQGHCIPTFYAKTEFDETSLTTGLNSSVRGILLEYIDGLSLEDIEVDSPVALGNPHIGQRIFDIFRKVTEMGIIQNDVRPANVMARNDGRVFLIDFAQAILRDQKNFSAKHWTQTVEEWGDLDITRKMLDEKQLRDMTPPAPVPDPFHIYDSLWEYNKQVTRGREEWRRKYYRPAESDDGYKWACKMDEEGVEGARGFPDWYLIEQKAKERKEILESFRDLVLDNL